MISVILLRQLSRAGKNERIVIWCLPKEQAASPTAGQARTEQRNHPLGVKSYRKQS